MLFLHNVMEPIARVVVAHVVGLGIDCIFKARLGVINISMVAL